MFCTKYAHPKCRKFEKSLSALTIVARGAALMTGTEVTIEFDAASADLIPNVTLASVMNEELLKTGPVTFSPEEKPSPSDTRPF